MTSKNLQIFILSFGRSKVPTLNFIANKSDVIILTSTDNEFKDKIESKGARVVVFDKEIFRGRGLEMTNEESVDTKRSALYGYNYAIEWGRKNGVQYICVLDDDYFCTFTINNRNENYKNGCRPMLDKWAAHAVEFMKKYPVCQCVSSIDNGQLGYGSVGGYMKYLKKRICTNTIVFNVEKEQNFLTGGNGDFINSMLCNVGSLNLAMRLQTIAIEMETIKSKKHETVDYSGMFYKKYSLIMQCPAYSYMAIRKGGKDYRNKMFNSFIVNEAAPKIINLE